MILTPGYWKGAKNNIPTITLPDINRDADEESEGQYQSIVETSMDDEWKDWEELDFLSTDNDSADKCLLLFNVKN